MMKTYTFTPDPAHKTVMYWVWAIVFTPVAAGLAIGVYFVPNTEGKIAFAVIDAVFALIMALYILWIPAFYKTLEYSITDDSIIARLGVFWKKKVTVPYGKITNVDISEGPLQRRYGLSTVHVQTAGAGGQQGASAELRIAGIRNSEEIKDAVMENIRAAGGYAAHAPAAAQSDTDIVQKILREVQAIRSALEK